MAALRFGPWVVLRVLGRGGMGELYAARHAQTGQDAAVKVMRAELVDGEALLRFEREVRALVAVRHPGVVAPLDAGRGPDGRPWLAMEHVQGESLHALVQRGGPMRPADAGRLIEQVARALDQVHAQGIVHRDIKPENILVGADGAPRIVDFGLARFLLREGSLTASSELLGTPAYMAPEQADGRHDAQGVRTDVYGLGAVLYHALTGRPPAEGRSALEVLARVDQGARPRLRDGCPGISPALQHVIERALARDPDERFASADELARALEGALADDGAPRTRWPLALATTGAGLAVVVAALASGGADDRPTAVTDRPRRAPAPPTVMTTAGEPAEAPGARRQARLPARVEEIGDPPATLPDWVGGQAVVVDVMGPVALASSLLERSRPDDLRALTLATQLCARELRRHGPEEPLAWALLARHFKEGRGVERSETEAVRCFEAAVALDQLDAAHRLGAALCRGELGLKKDLARGRALLRRVVDAPDPSPDLSPEGRRRAHLDVGWIALMDPTDEAADREALAALRGLVHPEAALLRSALHRRLPREEAQEAALIADLERVALDGIWAGEALKELVVSHEAAGRSELADDARRRLEGLATRGDPGGLYALAWLVLAATPDDPRRPALLFEGAATSSLASPHVRYGRIELLRLCRREEAAGRRPPVPIARAVELVRREPDHEVLLRDVR